MNWTHGEFTLTDDSSRLDISKTHAFLDATYWAYVGHFPLYRECCSTRSHLFSLLDRIKWASDGSSQTSPYLAGQQTLLSILSVGDAGLENG
jgi:hypothetical protein